MVYVNIFLAIKFIYIMAMSQNPGTQMVPSNSWFMDSYPKKILW